MKLEKVLENYGLTRKQALLYITCLELGSASVYKIAKKANLPRSTCYEALESLREKKLVTIFQKKSVKYYNAEDPRRAIDIDKEKIEIFEKALPEFNALYNTAKIKPTVRFYEGKGGMKIILEEILDEAKELLGFSSAEDYFATLEDYLPGFLEKRIKKRIPVKAILKESSKAYERKRLGPGQLREVRIIPSSYNHHGMIVIWGKKIAMFSFQKEVMVLVIESEELALSQRMMFNFIWDSLENK